MQLFYQIVSVALGSALGGLARWSVGLTFLRFFGNSFPWGTLSINIMGSFILGWFVTAFHDKNPLAHLFIAVGFTGGFTTFSAFELDTLKMIHNGFSIGAILYVTLSVFLGLLFIRLGVLCGQSL